MIKGSYPVKKGDYLNGGQVSLKIKEVLRKLGIASEIVRRVMIVVYEAEMNLIIHSYGGEIKFYIDDSNIHIVAVDTGPGIPDIDLAMKEGYSTAPEEAREMGFGAGMGLPNILKNSDDFSIYSEKSGTCLNITIFLKTTLKHARLDTFVKIDSAKCKYCMRCVTACPTQAIRVWRDGVHIISHRCINCNRCIGICPTSVFDIRCDVSLEGMSESESKGKAYIIPLPVFSTLRNPLNFPRFLNVINKRKDGIFYPLSIWEEALRKEVYIYMTATRDYSRMPVIIPSCPAVIFWIQTEFPSLIENVAPYLMPFQSAIESFPNGTEITFVPSCPSQVCTLELEKNLTKNIKIMHPFEAVSYFRDIEKSEVEVDESKNKDMREVFDYRKIKTQTVFISGVDSVRKFLVDLEKGKLAIASPVVELYACPEGCYGSPFWNVEPATVRQYFEDRKEDVICFNMKEVQIPKRIVDLKPREGIRLDEDILKAITKLSMIEERKNMLPGRDCGACGAPTCLDFAEDIVLKDININYCPYYKEEH